MTRRQMARRVDAPVRRWSVPIATVAAVLVVGLLGAMVIFGGRRADGPPPTAPHPTPSALVAVVSPTLSAVPSAPAQSVSASPSVRASSLPTSSPVTSISPSPPTISSPTSAPPDSAPQSADQFDIHEQVIDMGFPLRADTEYHYRDNFLDRRTGPPDAYNHAKIGPTGELVRLHDGIDIYAPENEPVLSPFDGVVIDPASKWSPWEPDRYGLTIVVVSDESTSPGYTAVLVHLDKVWVEIGQHVARGQVIGVLGRTGNAEDVQPQLHFELRAPFLIDWSALGEEHQVDAFNPYPSLLAADPKA